MVPEQEMCLPLSHRLLYLVSFRENESLHYKNGVYTLVNDVIIGFTSTAARNINDWSFNILIEVKLVYAYCMTTILQLTPYIIGSGNVVWKCCQ